MEPKPGMITSVQGPQKLNDASTAITVTGYTVAGIAGVTTTPATGGGVVATNLITAPISAVAFGLQSLKTIRNPTKENIMDWSLSAAENVAIYKIGKVLFQIC